jgi:phosphatidate cytidylyltransferase
MHTPVQTLMIGIVGFLATATLVGRVIRWRVGPDSAVVRNLVQRINAWWLMVAVAVPCVLLGPHATTILYALLSELALREFLLHADLRPADRPAVGAAFLVALPLQYALVWIGWYGLFAVFLPVYGCFVLAALTTVAQDSERFLERVARLQFGVMTCIYGLSHAAALAILDIPGSRPGNAALLVWFLLVAQLSDVLQYICGKLFGRHAVAPVLSPNKTWEGLVGGAALACAVGTALHRFTPFEAWQAAALALVIVVAGFFGGLVLSAIKRSIGVKDWGSSIPGHGGVLDRLDSVAFSAPIFFHLVRFWFAN